MGGLRLLVGDPRHRGRAQLETGFARSSSSLGLRGVTGPDRARIESSYRLGMIESSWAAAHSDGRGQRRRDQTPDVGRQLVLNGKIASPTPRLPPPRRRPRSRRAAGVGDYFLDAAAQLCGRRFPEGRPQRDTGRAMSQENVEVVRRVYSLGADAAGIVRGDYDDVLRDYFQIPDCELLPPRAYPDVESSYRGVEGLRRWFGQMDEIWNDFRMEPGKRYFDVGASGWGVGGAPGRGEGREAPGRGENPPDGGPPPHGGGGGGGGNDKGGGGGGGGRRPSGCRATSRV